MTNEAAGRLHLSSLSIRGFRGIESLDIPRLGRVTLLGGENGVGKTSVLEAVRIYALRGTEGTERVLSALLDRREEFVSAIDEDGDQIAVPSPATLFHGRDVAPNSRIEIGSENCSEDCLRIEAIVPNEKQANLLEKLQHRNATGDPENDNALALRIEFGGYERVIPWRFPRHLRSRTTRHLQARTRKGYILHRRNSEGQQEIPRQIPCQSLGPGLLDSDEVTELWDDVALTPDEEHAVDALNLVLGGSVERFTMIGHGTFDRLRLIVKLRDRKFPVPLRSLGDGATRLFGVALALAGSRNGFLIIDEAENGIHYTLHQDFWRMILQAAKKNNVQVLAATHSFDCIKGFAYAAEGSHGDDGLYVRLDRREDRTRAVVYSESELEIAADQGIELR